MTEAMTLLDLIDRLDVPTLAVIVVFGFWKIVRLIDKVDRHISERTASVEAKQDFIGATLEQHVADDKEKFAKLFDRVSQRST